MPTLYTCAARSIVTLAAVAGLSSMAQGATAKSPYVGLWETIDAHDGARTARSITPNQDGTFTILATSDYFSTCEASNGRGKLSATGVLDGDVLVASDTVIECANGDVFERLPDEYRYDPETDLLTQVRVGVERPPFILHRTSAR